MILLCFYLHQYSICKHNSNNNNLGNISNDYEIIMLSQVVPIHKQTYHMNTIYHMNVVCTTEQSTCYDDCMCEMVKHHTKLGYKQQTNFCGTESFNDFLLVCVIFFSTAFYFILCRCFFFLSTFFMYSKNMNTYDDVM